MNDRSVHPVWAWLGRGLLLGLFFVLMWLHCSSKINFITADLGRHIRNGEVFVKTHQVISTNFYAYVHTDFPVICHHWGTGVLFYWVHQMGGFMGLSVFYTALLTITGGLFMAVAWRWAGLWPALLTGMLALPLLAYRVEIRPEGLTTLFLGIEFLILWAYRARRFSVRWLWAIPVIQLVWINTHILFISGFVLMTFFLIDAFINSVDRAVWKTIAFIGAVAAGLSLINPFGLQGFLTPFNILKVYGYALAENQSVFFMMNRFPGNVIYGYFLALFTLAIGLLLARFALERKWRTIVLEALVLLFFGVLAIKAVRTIAMFGLLFVPLCAFQMYHVIFLAGKVPGMWMARGVKSAAISLILLASLVPAFFFSPLQPSKLFLAAEPPAYQRSLLMTLAHPAVWGDLAPDVNGSAAFFKTSGLKGPVFNNYDIGGYLIYHLFPQERPFVDNRPEAYPNEFFSQVYGPMQEKPAVWQEVDRKYGFQVIYFYRHDQTTWAQPFLLQRVDDPAWAPVFVDAYTIIFARRGGVNQGVIERFELPKSMFHATSAVPASAPKP
ncbi:MAG: hypothetical protein HQL17_07770 [Candidatus Omnitrophica bacterium]|nr:hypothetical protein [Candidatus Omnitrophota bacterium]